MKSIVAYLRNFLGWCDKDDSDIRTNFKRDRTDDVLPDEAPPLKRLKQLRSTNFPDIISCNDSWEKKEFNVQYVPIQVERGHPSASAPLEGSQSGGRVRTVPVKLVEETGNGPATPLWKPRAHSPVRPVMHAEVDNDDEEEVTWVMRKPGKSKKPAEVYVDLENEDHDPEDTEDDVIFVKKVSDPSAKPYKLFVTQNDRPETTQDIPYRIRSRITRKQNDRHQSPKSYTKLKARAGVINTYKKKAIPKWMQPQKPSAFPRSRLLNANSSNIRSTLSEMFNLEEKRNYQELIRRVAGTTKPVTFSKPIDIYCIADDSASFRNTKRAQRKSLNEIRLVDKGLIAEREGAASKEYDPITVAYINSSDSEIEAVPSESYATSSVKIDPINTLKDSYRDKHVTSTDWLAKIYAKYRIKRQETQVKLKDARFESNVLSKVNYEQKLAHLEHKLKHELGIPESLIEEPQPTVELPELTPEQEKLVNRALDPSPKLPEQELLVEKFNLRLTRYDLRKLNGVVWLNDQLINFYMNLLNQRSTERPDLPKVYAFSSYFCTRLAEGGHSAVRRWTKKVDIFAHDLMIVPVHLGVHWCLSIVDFRSKKIQYLDSMGGRNQPCLDALLQYLRDEHRDKKGQPFDEKGWKLECLGKYLLDEHRDKKGQPFDDKDRKLECLSKDIPQQMNGSDCGMFSCTFAEFSARDAPYTFSQQHMPYLRRKAALEILIGRLLL